MLNDQDSNMAANAICHTATMIQEEFRATLGHYTQAHAIYKPKLTLDGNQWCALYGDDLQSGIAAFGDSPAEAMWAWDKEWHKKIPKENGK